MRSLLYTLTLLLVHQVAQITLLDTSQYHFVPNGSYLQYSLSSMNLEKNQINQSISQFVINVCVELVDSTDVNYNILVLPQASAQSADIYQSYAQAVAEGVQQLMVSVQKNSTEPETACSQCYQSALYSREPTLCLNCQEGSFEWSDLDLWNSTNIYTILTIIDNTPIISPTGGYIQLFLQYSVNVKYDEEYYALFILFISVICSFIVIAFIIAVFLMRAIKKVELQITKEKQLSSSSSVAVEEEKKGKND